MSSQAPKDNNPPVRIINPKFELSLPKWNASKVPNLPEVCFAGRSNVGKSSLINALVNQKSLARTSSTPGRTQSLVVFSAHLSAGNYRSAFHIVDLPGYGYAKVPLEMKKSWRGMVSSYFQKNKRLECCVFLVDIRRIPSEEDLELIEMLDQFKIPLLPVITKIDKVVKNKRVAHLQKIAQALDIEDYKDLRPVSVKDNIGLKELREDIFYTLKVDHGES